MKTPGQINIRTDEIDISDTFFSVTRSHADDLVSSIREFGILEPPVLEKKDDAFRVVDGFGRVRAACQLGLDLIPARIVDRVDGSLYISLVVPMAARGEMGPVGKVRALSILRDYCGVNDADERIGRKVFGIAGEFLGDSTYAATLMSLPLDFKEYLDSRDPGFRYLKLLLDLPVHAIEYFIRITGMVPLRVNIFRSMLDLAVDIIARDGSLPETVFDTGEEDRRKIEDAFYAELFTLRYPEYSALRADVRALVDKISHNAVSVDFPEFFEGGAFRLCVRISASDTADSVRHRLDSVDAGLCARLAAFL